jgi:hypothetical protein
VTDEHLFAALDPNWPGLAEVMAAYEEGRIEQAKKRLIDYFRQRTSPRWFFDYRGQPIAVIDPNECRFMWGDSRASNEAYIRNMMEDADRLCRHQFFGEAPFDLGDQWDRYPLFNLNGEDNKPLRVTANRFVRMNFLNSLAIAYHRTREEKYGETFGKLLESLADGLLVRYPYVPDPVESAESYSLQFSKSPFRNNMSVARSALNIINVMHTELFYSDFVPARVSFRLFRFAWYAMAHHLTFTRNRYRHHNHHLFERGMMPLIIGTLFPEFPMFRPLLERGKEVILEHLEKDFHPSGGYDEHSLAYTCATTLSEFLVPIKNLAELNGLEGFGRQWDEAMHRTYSFYSGLVLPNGNFPDIGDGGGCPASLILQHGIQLYRNETARAVLRSLDQEEGEPDSALLPPLIVNDPLTGYLCARDGWSAQANCLVLSNKEYTRQCSHNHIDMLSLIIAVRGETLIGEPQAAVLYKLVSNNSRLDDYMRGHGSHNAVFVGGVPVTKGALRRAGREPDQSVRTEVLTESEGAVYAKASHDAYAGARHTREVRFTHGEGWRIADTVEGAGTPLGGGAHIQRWHLEHRVAAESIAPNALLLPGRRAKLLCVWPQDDRVEIKLWRNEESLVVEEVRVYERREDLPWIVDVHFPPSGQGGAVRLACELIDVTDDTSPSAVNLLIARARQRMNQPLSL